MTYTTYISIHDVYYVYNVHYYVHYYVHYCVHYYVHYTFIKLVAGGRYDSNSQSIQPYSLGVAHLAHLALLAHLAHLALPSSPFSPSS